MLKDIKRQQKRLSNDYNSQTIKFRKYSKNKSNSIKSSSALNMNKTNQRKMKVKEIQQPKFKIIRQIGHGCFGFVFEALAIHRNHMRVAWKRMYKNSNKCSRELKILELLKGTNHCIQLTDFFYTYDEKSNNKKNVIQNFILECCDNDLESILRMMYKNIYQMEFINAKKIVYQILLGIKEMHDRSICHRDLKPENIFFKDNQIKIGDFGSSKQMMSFEDNTPYVVSRYYRAPELIIGIKTYSLNIDIFAVAVIFFELVTGRLPFKGKSEGEQLVEIIKNLGSPDETTKRVYRVLTGWHHKLKCFKNRANIPINQRVKSESYVSENKTVKGNYLMNCSLNNNHYTSKSNNRDPMNQSHINLNQKDFENIFNNSGDESTNHEEIIFQESDLDIPPYKLLFAECQKEVLNKKKISPIWTEKLELLLKIKPSFDCFKILDHKKDYIPEIELDIFKESYYSIYRKYSYLKQSNLQIYCLYCSYFYMLTLNRFLLKCWNLNFFERFTAEEALKHDIFYDVRDCYLQLKLPK